MAEIRNDIADDSDLPAPVASSGSGGGSSGEGDGSAAHMPMPVSAADNSNNKRASTVQVRDDGLPCAFSPCPPPPSFRSHAAVSTTCAKGVDDELALLQAEMEADKDLKPEVGGPMGGDPDDLADVDLVSANPKLSKAEELRTQRAMERARARLKRLEGPSSPFLCSFGVRVVCAAVWMGCRYRHRPKPVTSARSPACCHVQYLLPPLSLLWNHNRSELGDDERVERLSRDLTVPEDVLATETRLPATVLDTIDSDGDASENSDGGVAAAAAMATRLADPDHSSDSEDEPARSVVQTQQGGSSPVVMALDGPAPVKALRGEDMQVRASKRLGAVMAMDEVRASMVISQEATGMVEATHDFTSDEPSDLCFAKGEVIALIAKSSDGWWEGEVVDAATGEVRRGLFPSTFVVELDPVPDVDLGRCEALYKCEATQPSDLSFEKGEIIVVLTKVCGRYSLFFSFSFFFFFVYFSNLPFCPLWL